MSASNSQPYLVIGTPCYGRQVTDLYASSLLKLLLACQRREVRLQVQMSGSDALITRARQNIVAHFLGIEAATHLLFIDADIGFEPEQVFRLLDFDAPMTADNYVSEILIVADGNPNPGVATFHLSPLAGKAEASTRIRLATTQNIIAVAKTSKGEFFTNQKLVKVTIGGCGG